MVEPIIDFLHGEVQLVAEGAGRFFGLRLFVVFVLIYFFISVEVDTDLAVEFIMGESLESVAGLMETGVAAVAVYHFVFVFALGAETYLAVCLEY